MSATIDPPNQIVSFFHCAQCLEELPADESPMSWQRIQAGWTEQGFQVWCVRHDINVCHFDLQGQKVKVIA